MICTKVNIDSAPCDKTIREFIYKFLEENDVSKDRFHEMFKEYGEENRFVNIKRKIGAKFKSIASLFVTMESWYDSIEGEYYWSELSQKWNRLVSSLESDDEYLAFHDCVKGKSRKAMLYKLGGKMTPTEKDWEEYHDRNTQSE